MPFKEKKSSGLYSTSINKGFILDIREFYKLNKLSGVAFTVKINIPMRKVTKNI